MRFKGIKKKYGGLKRILPKPIIANVYMAFSTLPLPLPYLLKMKN
jgi:hypothetical protein